MSNLIFPITKKEAEKEGIKFSSEDNKNAKFPSRLRKLRKEAGLSQGELAKKLGLSKSTVGLYETGDTLPDAQAIYGMAKLFNASADYLVCCSDADTNDPDLKSVCDYTGLSTPSLLWIDDMQNEPHREGLQVLDRMLATEEFRNIISYIVYISKIFDEIRFPKIWNNLNDSEKEVLNMARRIMFMNDAYEIYNVTLPEKAAAAKQRLQEMFIEMIDNLFFKELEYGEFPLETATGDKSTLIV